MSELNKVDIELIQKLKSRIEEISGLQSGIERTQKDFDFLIYYIEQKTGNTLSLTTIKRIWRDEFQRLPHISTLNMLTQLAFNADWLTLKKDLLEGNQSVRSHEIDPGLPKSISKYKNKRWAKILVGAGFFLAITISVYWYVSKKPLPIDTDKIEFSAKVTADGKIPNTVIFSYNISQVAAKRFFLQQSWDVARRVEITKINTKQTDVYYEPGYHYAKLFADAQLIKEIPVHIRYNDWFVRLRYPDSEISKIPDTDLYRHDHLGIKSDYINKFPEKFRNNFQLGYMLSRDFNVSGDAFQFSSSFKFDSTVVPSCPVMELLIKGDVDYIFMKFGNTGCESNLGLKFADRLISGKTNNLSEFGMDIFNWQNLVVKVTGKKVHLILNKKLILKISYSKTIGNIQEIDFFFNGIGAIDNIELKDSEDKIKFTDTFNNGLKSQKN